MMKKLISAALSARENSYAPYSGFNVGAAVLAADGRVFTGCNIENAAFSPTVCAERVAVFTAVAAGCRELSAIAVVGGKTGEETGFAYPCGVCRQVLSEFCGGDFKIIVAKSEAEYEEHTLSELLPHSFDL